MNVQNPSVWLQLPQAGRRAATVEEVETWARFAEDEGFDGVYCGDHLAMPVESRSIYPYAPDGAPFDPATPFLEAYTLLTYVAGMTQRIRLATAIAVLPLRHPVLLAKVTATLDVLSRGRLELGFGPGWHAEELALFGVSASDRGTVFDEYLATVRNLWSGEPTTASGAHVDVPEVVCRPAPTQTGGPPVWIGGHTDRALRRASVNGGRWMGAHPDADEIRERRRRLGQLLTDRGVEEPPRVGAQIAAGGAPATVRDCVDAGLDVVCVDLSSVPRAGREDAAAEMLAVVRDVSS